MTDNNDLFTFGSGNCGELGVGHLIPHTDELQKVTIYSNNNENEIEKVKYIAAGNYYSAAITTNGSLYTFGCGAYYRLGHGSDDNCLVPTRVVALDGVGDQLPNGTSTGKSSLILLDLMCPGCPYEVVFFIVSWISGIISYFCFFAEVT